MIEIGQYEFNPSHVIFTGHHGTLYEGNPVYDRSFQITIKEMHGTYSSSLFHSLEPFLKSLMQIQNPYLCNYIDYFFDGKEKLYLIMDYCAHGNLHDILQHNNLALLENNEEEIGISYCKQIIQGLLAIHEKGVLHGHLRPHNILVNYKKVKISNFGMWKINTLSSIQTEKKLTIYIAPESLQTEDEPTFEEDIWALGVILYEILYHKRPFELKDGVHYSLQIDTGKHKELDHIISKCLISDPKKRMTSKELRDLVGRLIN